MENATDALKMAAAILIFIGALSLALIGFTRATQTAGSVLSKSKVEYYNTENIRVSENRIVGIETIIPTLYSYFKEGYTIVFYRGSVDENNDLVSNISPLTLYYSEALPSRLVLSTLRNEGDVSYRATQDGKNISRAIYGIDANDEDTRQEPWLHDEIHAKYFIQSLINNTPEMSKYDMSRKKSVAINKQEDNKLTLNFDFNGGLINRLGSSISNAKDAMFIERIGTYNQVIYDGDQTASVDSSIIEFSNNEVMQNNEGTQKRVIQYIYIGNKTR